MRIVVLDDTRGIGEMLQQGLDLNEYTIVIYDSPSAFLATLTEPAPASRPFDLLIVDLFLSEGISGVEVTQHV